MNNKIVVTKSNVADGMRVVRGMDWEWGEQDHKNGVPTVGTVDMKSESTDGWVRVVWDSGNYDSYRIGKYDEYDLYVYQEDDIYINV